jgi:hypothetical protein
MQPKNAVPHWYQGKSPIQFFSLSPHDDLKRNVQFVVRAMGRSVRRHYCAREHPDAFNVIELLVTCAIIVILISTSFAVVARAKPQATKVSCGQISGNSAWHSHVCR